MLVLAGCATAPAPVVVTPVEPVAPVVAVDAQAPMRAVVRAFVAAAEAKEFEVVRGLLVRSLRERYSGALLARDFGAEPLAAARVAQIKAKVDGAFVERGESATLSWAEGRAVRLAREEGEWRISALE